MQFKKAGVKRVTVPKQSLSLNEIVKRFVRRESLPLSKEGVYESRFGDIEKMEHLDLTEKYEKIDELRSQIEAFQVRDRARQAAAKAAATPPVVPTPPVPVDGVPPVKVPPVGA